MRPLPAAPKSCRRRLHTPSSRTSPSTPVNRSTTVITPKPPPIPRLCRTPRLRRPLATLRRHRLLVLLSTPRPATEISCRLRTATSLVFQHRSLARNTICRVDFCLLKINSSPAPPNPRTSPLPPSPTSSCHPRHLLHQSQTNHSCRPPSLPSLHTQGARNRPHHCPFAPQHPLKPLRSTATPSPWLTALNPESLSLRRTWAMSPMFREAITIAKVWHLLS